MSTTKEWMLLQSDVNNVLIRHIWLANHFNTSTKNIRDMDIDDLIESIKRLNTQIEFLEKLKDEH